MDLESLYALPSKRLMGETVLDKDEILTEIIVPKPVVGTRSTYLKFKEKKSMDWALVSVAVLVILCEQTVSDVRLVLGGIAPVPWRVPLAEAALRGKVVNDANLKLVANIALRDATPLSHNGFKVPLAKALIRRAFDSVCNSNPDHKTSMKEE